MSHTTTAIAGGTTGALPDANVAIDRISSADYQRIKLADATEGSTSTIGVDANPLKVKNRRRGSTDYDTGISAVPAASTQLTAAATYVDRVIVTNVSDVQRWFSLTNAADGEIISQLPLAPRETRVLDLGGAEYAGLKWLASLVNTVRAQIVGMQ